MDEGGTNREVGCEMGEGGSEGMGEGGCEGMGEGGCDNGVGEGGCEKRMGEGGCEKRMGEGDSNGGLGCETGGGEEGVVASAGGNDTSTALDACSLAGTRFPVVLLFLGRASGLTFTMTAFHKRVFVFTVTRSPTLSGPRTFSSLLTLETSSKYSFPSYLDDPLSSYLSKTLSMVH